MEDLSIHDGEWYEYEVSFSVDNPLAKLRIDPSLSACRAEIDWVRVRNGENRVLKAWEFGSK